MILTQIFDCLGTIKGQVFIIFFFLSGVSQKIRDIDVPY